jgi:dipeptide transport system substrate-binding protein
MKKLGLAILLLFPLFALAKEKTLIYCSEGNPSGLNPQITEDGTSMTAQNPYYNRLVAIERGKTNIIPELASKWDISKDQKTYTFYLRNDAKFHKTDFFKPTRNMNADDVLFSFNRQRLKDHPYHMVGGGNYLYFENMEMNIIQDIQKIKEHVVQFTLKEPNSAFLANLTMEFASILSKEYADQMMEKKTPDLVDTRPIGTGPFILEKYEKDSMIRYRKNPNYFGSRKAQVDQLVFLITTDANVRTQKIQTGECHIIAWPLMMDYQLFSKDPDLKIQSTSMMVESYLAFNMKKKPFDNILVRKAISHVLNRKTYVEVIYRGLGEIADSALPSSMWGYKNNLMTYEYDVQKAKQLLKEAGYPNGFETELWALPVSRPYNPDGKKMAEMMQADLAKIGIKAKIITYDWPTYLAKTRAGEHSLMLYGWFSDNGDPDNFLSTQLTCASAKAGSNRAFMCNEQFDDLIQKARLTTNIGERTKYYEQAQDIFKKEIPWVPIATSKTYRVLQKNVNGFIMDPLSRDFFDGVSYE